MRSSRRSARRHGRGLSRARRSIRPRRRHKDFAGRFRALAYATQIADALDKAHRQGLVHRDLKPGNVMLTKAGAKLLDFGLAKATGIAAAAAVTLASTQSSPLTAQDSFVGTFQYMAPELFQGNEADARSDIFAFGLVVYEMLTGRKAFEGKTQASLIVKIMEHEPEWRA